MGRRLRAALIAAAVVVLPALFLGRAWPVGGVSALEDDLLYYLPIRRYIGERIREGEFPLWNPLVGMGTSIAGDPQSGLWYPPTYLFAALPPLMAYPVTILLHFALAGWGMYRFLRASRRDWQAALLGAVAFEFCGFLAAHRVHLTMLEAAAWIPWILYGWRRFADRGRYRHFALACAAFGLQMLVQHTQVSIMTAALVTAYAAVMLLPRRKSLLWQYPVGMTVGAAMAAVQTLPGLAHLAASGRGVPTFSTFVENSWVPTSGLLMLFPMLFGSRTPSFWTQEWWGLSHFCEQFAYPSIVILILAAASCSLVRRDTERLRQTRALGSRGLASSEDTLRREVLFWWGACLAALILALGEFTPASRLLFHLPVYRNLRVPARWVLVWSVALPILASAVISTIRQGGARAEKAVRAARWAATRLLPAATIAALVVLLIARWRIADLESAFGDRWGVAAVLAGLRSACRPDNAAILWPITVMALSATALLRWVNRPCPANYALVLVVVLVDLGTVTAFVDMDTRTYTRDQITNRPPLARAIERLDPAPGHRLLVPRYQADYRRPLEVLWPETNMLSDIPTFHAYGPFWPRASRLLFRFMPWGASEAMLELLRNRDLCAAMGIRFVAARTPEELSIIAAALAPQVYEPAQPLPGTENWQPVQAAEDLRWPVSLPEPGIYELKFQAVAGADSDSRWFVRLETPEAEGISFSRRLEPVDLSVGERDLTFLFVSRQPVPEASVRITSDGGHAVSVRWASFRRIAAIGELTSGTTSVPSDPNREEPELVYRTTTFDGVKLFELPEAVSLVRIAPAAHPVADLKTAIAELQAGSAVRYPAEAVYERTGGGGQTPVAGATSGRPADASSSPPVIGTASLFRERADEVHIRTDCAAEGLLVFNETFDPGWSATCDGRPVPILRVNAVVQGVIVPSGHAQIVFRYRPRWLRAGMWLSGLAMTALAAGGPFCCRWRP